MPEPTDRTLGTPHVLVVDDDARLRELIRRYLSGNGFAVTAAADATEARACLKSFAFDVLVLDRMMPGEDGLALARALRADRPPPILMLTAMGEAEERIAGLEAGVDDYLVKPFEPRELLLRLNAILRRLAQPPPAPPAAPPAEMRFGAAVFRADRRELVRGGRPVRLTEAETALLVVLAARPGEVVGREELARLTGASGGGRAVDVQVTRLRRKIESDPRAPRYLVTARGRGYALNFD
ncbi:MAG: DNA-binding response regulator [Rhodospirillales bacterium RIFCSPLOWO2_12_FULL_67_15]|nr:MAG: DNA-binding response regulator [Rhodospirillales bacterium RIFCSPLOWO2_12_FULL_67_15]